MKRGFIVGSGCNSFNATRILKNYLDLLVLKAHADDGGEGDDPKGDDPESDPEPTPTINYEDLITKARSEEKAKQRKKIEGLETKVNALTAQHNDDLLRIRQLEEDLKASNKKLTTAGQGDSEEIKTLKSELETLKGHKATLEKDLATLKDSIVDREVVEKEVRAELEKEYATKTYKASKLAEHKDDLLVPELVVGDTEEEIDKSLEVALAKSKEIREKLGYTGQPTPPPQGRTPKASGSPSISGIQNSKYSEEYIASLDVSSPEYAEFRKQMGLK